MDYSCLELSNQLCFPLYLCAKEITRRYESFLKPLNLTYTQYIVMLYFWEHGSSNVGMVGRTLLLDSGTLTPLLKLLEQKGYIKRERSEKDGRVLTLKVTPAGLKLRDEAVKIPEQLRKCLNLTAEEAKLLHGLLYKVLLDIKETENA